MDFLTQGVVGATFGQCVATKKEAKQAFIIGFTAGLLADMDVFIRSSADSLLSIEYHRHFTHSLAFIPLGGLLAALILRPFLKKKISFKRMFILASIGYSTHALLDACTSYGTMLLWPFSKQRIAWSIISVLDPAFTLGILSFSLCSLFKHTRIYVLCSLPFISSYLTFGLYQKNQIKTHLESKAKSRGHLPGRFLVKPTICNLILWKTVYEHDGYYYVDAFRIGLFSPLRFFSGEKIKKLDIENNFPHLEKNSVLYKDMQRFSHFSNGYVVIHPQFPNMIADMRYTLLPHKLDFLWGIEIYPQFPHHHARFTHLSSYANEKREQFFKMLWGSEIRRD